MLRNGNWKSVKKNEYPYDSDYPLKFRNKLKGATRTKLICGQIQPKMLTASFDQQHHCSSEPALNWIFGVKLTLGWVLAEFWRSPGLDRSQILPPDGAEWTRRPLQQNVVSLLYSVGRFYLCYTSDQIRLSLLQPRPVRTRTWGQCGLEKTQMIHIGLWHDLWFH